MRKKDSVTEVIVFPKNKKYSDFRLLAVDMLTAHPNINRGILVLFDEDGRMNVNYVCSVTQLSFAAASMMVESQKHDG